MQRGGLYDVGSDTPAPLAAIPATNRQWPAWSSRTSLRTCRTTRHPRGEPDALLAAISADPRTWMLEHAPSLIAAATKQHDPPHVPHPAGAS